MVNDNILYECRKHLKTSFLDCYFTELKQNNQNRSCKIRLCRKLYGLYFSYFLEYLLQPLINSKNDLPKITSVFNFQLVKWLYKTFGQLLRRKKNSITDKNK